MADRPHRTRHLVENGITSRIGLAGYACAIAMRDMAGSATATAVRRKNARRGTFMAAFDPREVVTHAQLAHVGGRDTGGKPEQQNARASELNKIKIAAGRAKRESRYTIGE